MAIKKKPFKNFNGTTWDSIYFETSEDQLKEIIQGGVDNLKYRKLPGGLIEQWGSVGIITTSNGAIDQLLTLPINFTVSNAFFAEAYIQTDWYEKFVHVRQYSASQIRIVVQNGLTPSVMYDIRYYCKGY